MGGHSAHWLCESSKIMEKGLFPWLHSGVRSLVCEGSTPEKSMPAAWASHFTTAGLSKAASIECLPYSSLHLHCVVSCMWGWLRASQSEVAKGGRHLHTIKEDENGPFN